MVAGAPLIDWLLLIGVAIALFVALRLLAAAILGTLRRIIPDHSSNTFFRIVHAALPPLALYGATVAFFFIAGRMDASIVARQMLLRGAGIAAWLSLGWFLFRLIDALARTASERMNRAERRQAASVITLLRRVAKLTLLVIIFIAVLDTFGIDVTTGIAALGIGGLALALGAQKTIENLVGSITIIGDQPVQVGDAAQIGDTFGTVEDVGMRSTRVRTINRTLVTIPNGFLAGEKIENFSARDQFLFKHVIGVSYETDAEKMSEVLDAIRAILADNEHIIDEDARARFIGFGESALNIEIYAYFRTTSFVEWLEMQEELLLSLMRKLKQLDVSIAFPTRTIQLNRDGVTPQMRENPEPEEQGGTDFQGEKQ
jgi:MscS family membrane protein